MIMTIELDITWCQQSTNSACCGPCCIKMVADYYDVLKTKSALIKLCKTDKDAGTTYVQMKKVLTDLGLSVKLITNEPFRESLEEGKPCIVCVPDLESHDPNSWHYVVLKGINDEERSVLVADPYYGLDVEYDGLEFYSKYFNEPYWCVEVGNDK